MRFKPDRHRPPIGVTRAGPTRRCIADGVARDEVSHVRPARRTRRRSGRRGTASPPRDVEALPSAVQPAGRVARLSRPASSDRRPPAERVEVDARSRPDRRDPAARPARRRGAQQLTPSSLIGRGAPPRERLHVEAAPMPGCVGVEDELRAVRERTRRRTVPKPSGGNPRGCPAFTGTSTKWARIGEGPRQRPRAVGRERDRESVAQPHRRRAVGRAQVDGAGRRLRLHPSRRRESSFPSAESAAVARPVEPGEVLARSAWPGRNASDASRGSRPP